MIRLRRVLAALLGVLLAASVGVLLAASVGPAAAAQLRQDALPRDLRLSPDEAARVARVVERNRAFLGARPLEFCKDAPAAERTSCLEEVERIAESKIDGPLEVTENGEATRVGEEWPGAGEDYRVEGGRRVRVSVPIRKGERAAVAEASVLVFTSRRGEASEACFFPLEHWTWADLDRPERFAHAPVGVCGKDRELTLADYLVEQSPDAAPWAIRFLSEPEARAWQSGDPEKIKHTSPYTAGHPYAKYFLLGSLRWWRGGKPPARRPEYGWVVRIDELPLRRVRELEKQGELFLDVFEDGAQVELTNVTREGLVSLLAEKPVVYTDRSGPGDRAPELVPLGG
ncbi:MAG: hypothetical protein FJ144_20305 [Deltaproteobacteria bacterium]|nr:hypothetical protein [Deltaproteobacteria bacterium]